MSGAFEQVRVGVLGDFALDAYWHADMTASVLSRETPHYPLPVVREQYAPGAAGNVAVCAARLGARVSALGALGQDWRGAVLRGCLEERGVDTRGLLSLPGRVTNAYIKPMRHGLSDVVYEDPRLDFCADAPLSGEPEAQLLAALDSLRDELDILCVCDQTANGCVTPALRRKLSALAQSGLCIVADSREHIADFTGVVAKPNELEALRAFPDLTPREAALALAARNGRPSLVTLGEKGCLVCHEGLVTEVPAFPVEPPVDICGAGDAFLAALAVAFAAGASLSTAARIGCAASAVVIRKLGETGSASREELTALLGVSPETLR